MYRYVYKITLTEGDFKDLYYYGKHTTNKLNIPSAATGQFYEN